MFRFLFVYNKGGYGSRSSKIKSPSCDVRKYISLVDPQRGL